jgi:hypothetical protein
VAEDTLCWSQISQLKMESSSKSGGDSETKRLRDDETKRRDEESESVKNSQFQNFEFSKNTVTIKKQFTNSGFSLHFFVISF